MKNEDKYIEFFHDYLVGSPNASDEWRAYCPLCEDPGTSTSPSSSFNFTTGEVYCQSCGKGGGIATLFKQMNGSNVVSLKSRKKVKQKPAGKTQPLPSDEEVEEWHERLMTSERHHSFMNDRRGIDDDTLAEFGIGWDGRKYTIPIWDEDGELVNVRRYNPKATEHKYKMVNIPGHGTGRIYGLDTLEENHEVVLAEGELDRLVAIQQGLPAVTHTSGASVFQRAWARLFRGKVVYVAYDDDESGDKGAAKVADVLKDEAEAVYRLRLKTGIKSGDITDFFVTLGLDVDEWELRKTEAEPIVKPPEPHEVPTDGHRVTVEESQNATYSGPLELVVTVAGKRTPPYIGPAKINATCDQNAGAACNICPLMSADGKRTISIDPDDARLLHFIDTTDKGKHELYRQLVDAKCSKHVAFDVDKSYSIEELVVTPSVAHRSEAVETPIHRQLYNVGTYRTTINQQVRIVGQQQPDPRSQRGLFHGWHLERVDTDIDAFEITPELRDALKVFRPDRNGDPLAKCMEIAEDIATNVTHIFGRELLHVAYDLVFHSAISFNLGREHIPKGWLEGLIIGDTRTGKSEAATRIIKHYQAGSIHSCESVSLAGLLGGAQKIGSGRSDHWMVTWGVLPLNDRRLVVLDEMSGMYTGVNGHRESKNILENLSSVRSEGRAEIKKIAQEETSARTRILWITNPIDERRISDMPGSALQGLRDLIKNPEDIARFDFVMAVSNDEVSSELINAIEHDEVEHRYTSYLCHQLVTWAWSRTSDDIIWMGGADRMVREQAELIGQRYVDDPPLIQGANVRTKIARLAVAIAARTFSTNGSGEELWVKRKHVRAAVRFLDMVYGAEAMGYKQHSDKKRRDRDIAEKSMPDARSYLKNSPKVAEVLNEIGSRSFRPRDFTELGGIDRDEANLIVDRLRQWRMISSGHQGRLRIEPALVKLLKGFQ